MAGQQRVRVLEAGFAAKIDALQQALWDSSASAVALNKKWQETMAIRTQLVNSAAGAGTGGAVHGAGTQEGESNWKGILIEVYMRAKKERPVLEYTTVDVPEALRPGHGPYISQVTSQDFQTIYQGDPAISKKKAEHAAAQQALAHEFPAEYAALNNSGGARPPATSPLALKPPALQNRPPTALALTGGLVFALPGNAPPSKKRKVAEMGLGDSTQTSASDVRSRCQHALQLLLQRALTKSDVVFDSAVVEGTGEFVSSVSIPAYNPKLSFVGEACATKKLAENAACEALLTSSLAIEIERLTAEHQERRAAKNAESLAKLKADHKEKKAQKSA